MYHLTQANETNCILSVVLSMSFNVCFFISDGLCLLCIKYVNIMSLLVKFPFYLLLTCFEHVGRWYSLWQV